MVNFALPLTVLVLAASAAAAPAPGSSSTNFSFAGWVEDIIAHPDTALTPEEAVAAANAADVVGSAGGLLKRATCDKPWRSAPANDAAACLNDLARKGAQGVACRLPSAVSNIQMCRIGGAVVVASRGPSGDFSVNCNDVARTGGLIFDSCWRADNTVKGSELCINQRGMQINISGEV